MKKTIKAATLLSISALLSCSAMLPSYAQTLIEAIADETQTQYALTPNSSGTGFYSPVNDGGSFSSLGALAGANRTFKISGNSLAGSTDTSIIPKFDSNIASDKKGYGISLSSGQTLNIHNISPFIYFKDAITNDGGTLNITLGTFSYNEGQEGGVVKSTGSGNSVTIQRSNFSNNNKLESGDFVVGNGGAIYEKDGTLNIEGTIFENNGVDGSYPVSTGFGGAIYAENSTVKIDKSDVTSKFFNNTASERGGAIYSKDNNLTISESEFTGNKTTDLESSRVTTSDGGAIYIENRNMPSATNKISNSKFDNNSSVKGGAIHVKYANLEINNSTFDGNKATSVHSPGDAVGGAIYIDATNATLNTVSFKNNTANKVGGAIYITYDAKLKVINSTFADNFTDEYGKNDIFNDGILLFSHGGGIDEKTTMNGGIVGGGTVELEQNAIVELIDATIAQKRVTLDGNSNLTFLAQNDDINISGITQGIYLNGNETDGAATLTLNAQEGKTITLSREVKSTDSTSPTNDYLYNSLDLEGDGTINLDGKLTQTTVNVNGSNVIRNASGVDFNTYWNLNNGGVLYIPNDNVLSTQSHLNFNGGTLDLRNGVTSGLEIASLTLSNDSNLYLDVDLANRTMDNITHIYDNNDGTYIGGTLNIAGLNLLSDAVDDVTTINFTTAENIKSHIAYTGDRKLQGFSPLYKYDVSYLSNSGNFKFARHSDANPYYTYNPNIFGSTVALQGAYLTQLANYDIALGNFDHNMLMTQAQRMAWKYGNKYASNEVNPQVYSPLYIPQENAGIWFRPYTTFENVRLDNGPKVSNVMYGSLVGGDSDLFELKNGWNAQYSAFIGYNGSHQTYDGVGIYQNGGSLGATAAFFKGNFFEALTANVGASVANINTTVGDNDLTMLMTGIASKTGYNWELADGKFIIQPSWMMSYTFVNPMNDYTLNNGVRIQNDNLHAIQLSPSLKLIGNLKNGWQPYISFRMLWNILDDSKVQAAYVNLPQTTVKPYCEYGVGVQRTWGERLTGFGQAMIRNGGRNGVALSFGFRFALGKLNDKHQVKDR